MKSEWMIWEVVQDVKSLSEVKTWTLEEIEKYYSIMLMKRDLERAVRANAKPGDDE